MAAKTNENFRPNKRESIFPKVPTALLYEKGNPSNVVEWGHGAKMMYAKPGAAANYDLFTGFKLNLDENLKRPPLPNGMYVAPNFAQVLNGITLKADCPLTHLQVHCQVDIRLFKVLA